LLSTKSSNLHIIFLFRADSVSRERLANRKTEREITNGKESSETEDQKSAGSQNGEEVDRAQDRSQDSAQDRQKAGKESTAGCLRQPGYARRNRSARVASKAVSGNAGSLHPLQDRWQRTRPGLSFL
jgi:hypothetical protein